MEKLMYLMNAFWKRRDKLVSRVKYVAGGVLFWLLFIAVVTLTALLLYNVYITIAGMDSFTAVSRQAEASDSILLNGVNILSFIWSLLGQILACSWFRGSADFFYLSVLTFSPFILGGMGLFYFFGYSRLSGSAVLKRFQFETAVLFCAVLVSVVFKAVSSFLSIGGDSLSLLSLVKYSSLVFVDWLSFWLVILTFFLLFICSRILPPNYSTSAAREVAGFLYFISSALILAFTTKNCLVFYIAFEAVVIPMFALMMRFSLSGAERGPATLRLVMFTLVGSVPFLVVLILVYVWSGSFDFSALLSLYREVPEFSYIWALGLFWAFAFKIPLFPLHGWLTEAHVEAPTVGSILLAGLLLKLGTYGLARYVVLACPSAVRDLFSVLAIFPVVGFTFATVLALWQSDLKRFVAYSSIAHMGFLVLGLLTTTWYGVLGSFLMMISHGVVSAGLFAVVGMIYDRYHVRSDFSYSGLGSDVPRLARYLVFFLCANAGLPALGGFPGEFLLLTGVWHTAPVFGILCVFGFFGTAVYSFWAVATLVFGTSKLAVGGASSIASDLTIKEEQTLVLLSIPTIVLGVFPYIISGCF